MSLIACANCHKPLAIGEGLSENFYCCSTCSRKVCEKCGEKDKECKRCDQGTLLYNTWIEPKGDYRLPAYLRLPTIEEKLERLKQEYENGIISLKEHDNLRKAILDPTVKLIWL